MPASDLLDPRAVLGAVKAHPFMRANATLPVGTYGYQLVDLAFLNDRIAQFRDQVARRLSGDLSEDEFKPLRLMNGLYLQLHAYMLRVAIP
jgi:sulfite reductase (NADPH) hemoprotein beta-component